MLVTALVASLAAGSAASVSPAETHQAHDSRAGIGGFVVVSDSEILADGVRYTSWQALADSGYFHQDDTRCATFTTFDPADPGIALRGVPNDCSLNNTNPAAAYAPSVAKYRIPVVVHVIQNTSGTGFISAARVESQIDVLNEDFLALAGSNGAPGFDAQIEFYLATEDPSGNPTTGITYTTNNTWFNDSGTYYNTLNWDTDRYLNIYTNSASGALGYVPGLPQEGIVGSNSDRVVILYSTFGRNAPLSPYNLGRTATHEVGHYLGLFHTFDGGCASAASCSTNGDRVCDTNPEASPTFGCPGSRTTCGVPAPFNNYMDYTDDACMNRFTANQSYRMRCTLINYRPSLYEIATNSNEPCNGADVAPPYGTLDFFDVSNFLLLYNIGDQLADLVDDNVFNFFDVSAFLAQYNAGCP
jgi:hypothetical protein